MGLVNPSETQIMRPGFEIFLTCYDLVLIAGSNIDESSSEKLVSGV